MTAAAYQAMQNAKESVEALNGGVAALVVIAAVGVGLLTYYVVRELIND